MFFTITKVVENIAKINKQPTNTVKSIVKI